MRTKAAILIAIFLACSFCNDDVNDLSNSNESLKMKLQGRWKRENASKQSLVLNTLSFEGDSLIWKDSTVSMINETTGTIQTVAGRGLVKYTHHDDVNYCSRDLSYYMFENNACDDIIWLCLENAKSVVITNYVMEEGMPSISCVHIVDPFVSYITTSYVEFREGNRYANFCTPVMRYDISCLEFTREEQ